METTRLKNLGGIKSGVGLVSSYVVAGGSAVCKFQHHRFPLWCVNFFVTIISTRLLLKRFNGVFISSRN